jgi:ubiquitin-conjugating enzyme E2 A
VLGDMSKSSAGLNPARKRLMRDFKKILKDPPPCLTAAPNDDDIMHWQAVIFG